MDTEGVQELLAAAVAAVDQAGVPDDLRPTAYASAISLLTADRALYVTGSHQEALPDELPRRLGSASGTDRVNATGSCLEKIAAGLGLPLHKVQRVYASKDGAPHLILSSKRLPKTKSAAAFDIALLEMAGRQLSQTDDYTEGQALRETVKRYGKFDRSNFAGTMKSLDNLILTIGKGAGAKRKLTQPGIDAAADLVLVYATED